MKREIAVICAVLLLAARGAHASMLSPETEDTIATGLALFVIFIVPVVFIVLFWMVHILPEKIAHSRHHPQLDAIRTLCLLSLVFGGLLWPIAWLWAYSKPVFHKMAYGTDVNTDAPVCAADEPSDQEREPIGLHERVARLEEHGIPAADLEALRVDIEALETKFVEHGVQ